LPARQVVVIPATKRIKDPVRWIRWRSGASGGDVAWGSKKGSGATA
jgi:hypothetical protein